MEAQEREQNGEEAAQRRGAHSGSNGRTTSRTSRISNRSNSNSVGRSAAVAAASMSPRVNASTAPCMDSARILWQAMTSAPSFPVASSSLNPSHPHVPPAVHALARWVCQPIGTSAADHHIASSSSLDNNEENDDNISIAESINSVQSNQQTQGRTTKHTAWMKVDQINEGIDKQHQQSDIMQ